MKMITVQKQVFSLVRGYFNKFIFDKYFLQA